MTFSFGPFISFIHSSFLYFHYFKNVMAGNNLSVYMSQSKSNMYLANLF